MEAVLRQLMRGTAVRLSAVVWLFGYILVDLGAVAQGRSAPGVMLLCSTPLLLLGIVQSVLLGMLLDRLTHSNGLVRWGTIAVAGLAAAMVQTAAEHVVLSTFAQTLIPSWQSWALSLAPSRKVVILILYLWTIYLTLALKWASRTADVSKLNEARAAAFAAAAARAEAAALRLQLNPHFLFNTLNGIASLVVRNRRDQAEEMIGRLADFLRSSLTADPTAQVPLAQEVETARAYLTIEEARFGPRLRVDYAIDPLLTDLDVPNFILQPLVENAIQHGAAPVQGEVAIRIAAERTAGHAVLTVSNRAAQGRPGAAAERGRQGIGLANTRARLLAQYGSAAALECSELADGYRAAITLPLAPAVLSQAS